MTGSRITALLLLAGLGGLLLSSVTAGGPPAWVWLSLVAGGVVHSVGWRAAHMRRVSARERRAHAVRLRNAERRERKHLRATLRTGRRMKQVLAEVREHPGMEWAQAIASTVRGLQEGHARHEAALVHGKMLTEKTAADLSSLVDSRFTDED